MPKQYLTLSLPPGVYKNGTEYQSAGRAYTAIYQAPPRWVDSSLVRWHQGEMRPIGGWESFSANTVSGKARAILPWADNTNTAWIGIGTHSGLYVMDRYGNLYNITPSGFLPGYPDAVEGGGYGTGGYGAGTYGTIRTQSSEIQDATTWDLDTWGQYLVGVSCDDNRLWQWELGTGTPAAKVANSPTASSLVVTNEYFMMALGANNNPRLVQWCDQQDNTDWTPSLTNQAGQFPLQTYGRLMCGRRITGATLLFTDQDVFVATYLGNTLVYGFERAGSNCGVISRKAAVALDAQAIWMGRNAFYQFNGYVTPIPCDVADYLFGNINPLQISKIHAVVNRAFGEVTWFYPSLNSTEIDSYVTYSYTEQHWEIGQLARLCAADQGVYPYPLMVDGSGEVWEHETGFSYGGASPYARSGPLELGNGDQVMSATQFLPDATNPSALSVEFLGRFQPDASQVTFGPYALSPQTDVRFTARQIEMLFTGTPGSDWRLGSQRLEVTAGGRR